MEQGERQVAPDLSGIRRDHVARYEWAAEKLLNSTTVASLGQDFGVKTTSVIDLACGVGYGSRVLAKFGHSVVGVDREPEAIAYAIANYGHARCLFLTQSAEDYASAGHPRRHDAAVCFETIEHIEDPLPLLKALNRAAPLLLASVPNEDVMPFKCEANGFQGYAFHHRHYTPAKFQDLLNAAGWEVTEWWGQVGPESEVERDVEGRTLIAVCARSDNPKCLPFTPTAQANRAPAAAVEPEKTGIGHVVILGLGPSAEQYMDLVKRLGGRKAFADEVWTINALGDVLACDRIFHMDDIRVQEMRAAALPDSNIAQMVKWLRTSKVPVITSRAHPDYPALVEFPLEDVINSLGYAYFNGTAAYAVAQAIHEGASKISFFGCDFSYRNAHHAEQGRACLEFWIGFAAARGIKLGMADSTSLLDTCDAPKNEGEINVYGFDFDHVMVDASSGAAKITFKPRDPRPTAAEIEHRYDHTRHPSPLLR